MSRKLALPLFLLTFALCVIFASRTPQPIIEELPSDAADAPAVLLTLTECRSRQEIIMKLPPCCSQRPRRLAAKSSR